MNKTYCKNVIKDLNKKYLLYKIVNSNFKFYKDIGKPDKILKTLSELILYLKYKNIPIPINIINEQDTVLSHLNLFNYIKYFSYICLIRYKKKFYKISHKIYNIYWMRFCLEINDKNSKIAYDETELVDDYLLSDILDVSYFPLKMYLVEYIEALEKSSFDEVDGGKL